MLTPHRVPSSDLEHARALSKRLLGVESVGAEAETERESAPVVESPATADYVDLAHAGPARASIGPTAIATNTAEAVSPGAESYAEALTPDLDPEPVSALDIEEEPTLAALTVESEDADHDEDDAALAAFELEADEAPGFAEPVEVEEEGAEAPLAFELEDANEEPAFDLPEIVDDDDFDPVTGQAAAEGDDASSLLEAAFSADEDPAPVAPAAPAAPVETAPIEEPPAAEAAAEAEEATEEDGFSLEFELEDDAPAAPPAEPEPVAAPEEDDEFDSLFSEILDDD